MYIHALPLFSSDVHSDIACKYDGVANIHPFAFRTHAHGLGKVITGYLIRNGEWTVIAQGDPQWPQVGGVLAVFTCEMRGGGCWRSTDSPT